jgi:hypothetical protein
LRRARIQKNVPAYHPCPQAYDRFVEIVYGIALS